MKLPLSAVELDTTIQCRAAIDTGVVDDYAERMRSGDEFPPIVVYGSRKKCWIGDGWHRTFAARQCGAESIAAEIRGGGRVDALKHALGANALHGHRRTNADKRRCVEIALREFPKLSNPAIGKLCGVADTTVADCKVRLGITEPEKRIGQDGKQYPAQRQEPAEDQADETTSAPFDEPLPKLGPPRDGMDFARMALMDLEQIRDDDLERDAAFDHVVEWIGKRRG